MVSNLVNAIARQEGYGIPGVPATRNNNPGNIVFGSFAASYGATKDPNSQFAVFPNSDIGFSAATDLLSSSSYSNLSIADAIYKWNGKGSNSSTYVQNVSNWIGLDPNTTVSDALAGSYSTDNNANYSTNNDGSYSMDDIASSLEDITSSNNLLVLAGLGLAAILYVKFF